MAAATPGKRVRLWNRATGNSVFCPNDCGAYPLRLAWSPDGGYLAIVSNPVAVCEAASGKEVVTLRGHTGPINSLAWGPDSQRLVTSSDDGTVRIWQAVTGEQLVKLQVRSPGWGPGTVVAWSPDGASVAAACYLSTLKVWDAKTGDERLSLEGHAGIALWIAWSPDGARLASVGTDQAVKIWDASSGTEILTLRGYVGNQLRWGHDGLRLCVAQDDQRGTAESLSGQNLVLVDASRGYAFAKDAEFLRLVAQRYYNSAVNSLERFQLDESDEALRKAQELDASLMPEYSGRVAQAYCRLANAVWESGIEDDAAKDLLSASWVEDELTEGPASNSPDTPTVLAARAYFLGSLLMANGRQREALQQWDRLLRLGAADASILNSLAWRLSACGEPRIHAPELAVKLARNAVQRDASKAEIWNTLGVAQYRVGDWGGAIQSLEKSAKLGSGGNGFDWFFLAMVHWKLRNQDVARRWYEKAVGWMEANNPDDEELLRFREEAARLLGLSWDAFRSLADARARSSQWEEAAANLTKAIELNPNEGGLWRRRAKAQARLGRWDEALVDCSRAIALQPHQWEAWRDRALIYNRAGMRRQASEDLAEAIRLNPDDADLQVRRAQLSHPDVIAAWNFDEDAEGWVRQLQSLDTVAVSAGALRVQFEGSTFGVVVDVEAPAGWKQVTVRTRTNGAISADVQSGESGWRSNGQSLGLPILPAENAPWKEYAFYFYADWPLKDLWLMFDPKGKSSDTFLDIDWITLSSSTYERAIASLNEMIDSEPGEAWVFRSRGNVNLCRGRWVEAARDYARSREAVKDCPEADYLYAAALLLAGDVEGYDRYCASLLERFDETEDPDIASDLAWTCSLSPCAAVDAARSMQMAERAAKNRPKKATELYRLGLILYRAGMFDQALQSSEELLRATRYGREERVLAWLLLAMVHHRLGHANEAREWLDRALGWLDQAEAARGNHTDPLCVFLNSRISIPCELFRREATTLLEETGEAADGRDRALPADKNTSSNKESSSAETALP